MTVPGAPTPRSVDLHMHSTASDGVLSPAAVVAAAAKARLALMCLTDHDTAGGVPEARAAGEALGIEVAAGIELSAHDGDKEVHLLGLHLARLDVMEARATEFRAARERRGAQMVATLNAHGIPIALDVVLAGAGGGALGRPHVARALIAGGWVRDMREAFDKWLGNGRPACVEKERLDVADAIALVHAAGGVAVFAHPGADGDSARVERLAALGLDGLEIKHPSHTADEAARLMLLCDAFDLVPSGGSDWHGYSNGPRVLGGMQVPWEWVERQRERAERWTGQAA